MIAETTPARVIGDKAYDSDRLDQFLAAQGVEMIAPNQQWGLRAPITPLGGRAGRYRALANRRQLKK